MAKESHDRMFYGAFASYLYLLTRQLKPEVIVETGVERGTSTYSFLRAIHDNGLGELHSVDIRPYVNKRLGLLAPVVPKALKKKWHYHEGDSREVLPVLLEELGSIDLFMHGSDHGYDVQGFEASVLGMKAALLGYDASILGTEAALLNYEAAILNTDASIISADMSIAAIKMSLALAKAVGALTPEIEAEYNRLAPLYAELRRRFERFVPKYQNFHEQYAALLPRYRWFVPQYEQLIPRYQRFKDLYVRLEETGSLRTE